MLIRRVFVTVLVCGMLPASAQLNLKNGADLNMNGSSGSTIIFSDGTIQSTASTSTTPHTTLPTGTAARAI
ncbi:MAG TPA: hypothetical protein EYN96_12425 [Candidatus Hydrogenedentes bacterium]|nr:hypothetical protein [Candidatus Hydrogenedentota bacterium]